MKVKEVTNAYYAHVWKHHELLEFFLSDRDTQFIFNVWNHLCQMLKIDAKLFTAYHSQTNDQMKCSNVIMKHYLRAFVNYMQNDWAKWISNAEFSANNALSTITLASLFLTNSDQNSRLEFKSSKSLSSDIFAQSRAKLIDVKNFTKKMKELIEHLRDEMLIAQVIYEVNVNRSRRSCPRYFVNNEVWLNVKNLNIAHSTIKLDDHHVNSFQVKRVFEKNSLIVELELSEFMKIHSVFHVTLLSHVTIDSLLDQRQESRELVVAENDEWAWYVNRILNSKLDQRYSSSLLKYYIDWEDYFPIWESFNLVDNCQIALEKFHVVNSVIVEPHVQPCMISHYQCNDF